MVARQAIILKQSKAKGKMWQGYKKSHPYSGVAFSFIKIKDYIFTIL
jgi:hypothetical protein